MEAMVRIRCAGWILRAGEPGTYYALPFVVCVDGVEVEANGNSRRYRQALIAFVLMLVVISPWLIRNRVVRGNGYSFATMPALNSPLEISWDHQAFRLRADIRR